MKGTLVGLGNVTWQLVHDVCAELTCAWADYGGFHIGECPISAPPYSHLWAWSSDGDTAVRVRIDAGRPIVGLLLVGGQPVPRDAVLAEDVTIYGGVVRAWPTNDRSIGKQGTGVLTDMRTLDVIGQVPLRFIAGPADRRNVRV